MNYPRRFFLKTVALATPAACLSNEIVLLAQAEDSSRPEGVLSFQSGALWSPRINLNADTALVYGIGRNLPARIAAWRAHGYRTDVMTGIAWGSYENYLDGKYDGHNHEDEAQTDRFGHKVVHGSGGRATIYYMVPTESYVSFIIAGLKNAIDSGAEAICLEEPEFWVQSGYSGAFKREWQAYYGEAWRAPDSSPDAQYRASKLKYYLYRRALSEAFAFVKSYGKSKGRRMPCYVASHSLPNYSQWRIVSPESSLEQVNCDGYIAQVWTGTSRTPNVYEGKREQRTFETAFLEYGAMLNLSRVSGRALWLLNDPVEDNPRHSWTDYRTNWECTMTASLLHPQAWRYEIMPWPERVFGHEYPVNESPAAEQAGMVGSLESGSGYPSQHPSHPAATSQANLPPVKRSLIPQEYATELQVVIEALRHMKQPKAAVRWEQSGMEGAGILISDTMMFQRGDPHPSDPNLGSFYGLALPLLMRGLPLTPVQIEYAAAKNCLEPYRLLLLTYEGQKPPSPRFHQELAKWVRAGGALVMIDNDQDPYNAVREWWNTSPNAYSTPRLHLFKTLGLDPHSAGLHRVGKGVVVWQPESPAALSYKPDGAHFVTQLCKTAAAAVGLSWKESRTLALRRGPYIIGVGLDSPAASAAPQPLRGRFIDLYDPNLPILKEVALSPGRKVFLLDLDAQPGGARILAAGCRVRRELASGKSLRFRAEGIGGTEAVVRVALPRPAKSVEVDGRPAPLQSSDEGDGTLRIRFPNSIDGVSVEVAF